MKKPPQHVVITRKRCTQCGCAMMVSAIDAAVCLNSTCDEKHLYLIGDGLANKTYWEAILTVKHKLATK